MRSRTIRLAIVAITGSTLLATAVLAEGSPTSLQAGRPAARLARLTGAVEVPVGDPDGSGLSTVIVHPATGRLCFAIVVNDIVLPAIGAPARYRSPHLRENGLIGPLNAETEACGDVAMRRVRPRLMTCVVSRCGAVA